MTEYKVSPSILSGDFANMGKSVKDACFWGADLIHVDVMDGVYVPNITFGMPMVAAIKKYSTVPLDVHLMIIEPEKYVGSFVDSGADIVTFHPEASKDVAKGIEIIKSKGAKCGLVLNPDKPLDLVYPYINDIDMVLLMSVNPGFGGQKFINIVPKIKKLVTMCRESGVEPLIQVDGGITPETAPLVTQAGANVLVAGSAVFGKEDRKEAIAMLRR